MALTKISRSLLDTGISDSSDATAITIDSSENVGIATASPSQKLEVTGNVYVGGGNYFTQATSGYFFGGSGSFTNGVYGVGVNNMVFNVNGSERMRIDSSGIITKPYQPAFHVDADGTSPLAVNNTVVFNNARINVGNHYSTTTGKFTAPVNGKYLIYWSGIGNTAADVYRYYLRINDSDYLDGVQIRLDSRASAYDYGSKQEILSLSASDTVNIYFRSDSNNATFADDNFLTFGGFLLG